MIPEDAIWILELIRNRDARTEAEKDAVNAAIEALKAQLSQEGKTKGTTADLIDRQAAIDALDCINGVEEVLRSLPSAQPEPAIPLSWIENEIKWLKSLDNTFSEITALQISVMVKKWRDEQNESD